MESIEKQRHHPLLEYKNSEGRRFEGQRIENYSIQARAHLLCNTFVSMLNFYNTSGAFSVSCGTASNTLHLKKSKCFISYKIITFFFFKFLMIRNQCFYYQS